MLSPRYHRHAWLEMDFIKYTWVPSLTMDLIWSNSLRTDFFGQCVSLGRRGRLVGRENGMRDEVGEYGGILGDGEDSRENGRVCGSASRAVEERLGIGAVRFGYFHSKVVTLMRGTHQFPAPTTPIVTFFPFPTRFSTISTLSCLSQSSIYIYRRIQRSSPGSLSPSLSHFHALFF